MRRLGLLAPALPLALAPALALALALAVLVPFPAQATAKTVVVANDAFSPSAVTLVLGDSVRWSFRELHTSTSDQGFWDSGDKNAGTTFARGFLDSGTYPYHCKIHPMMHGKVLVGVKFAGTAARGYALRWSSRTSTPSTVKYDIQLKRFGTTSWVGWRTGTATRTGTFNPSGAHSYLLRVRTHVGAHVSSYSPNITLKIT
jgi:plastocyanin